MTPLEDDRVGRAWLALAGPSRLWLLPDGKIHGPRPRCSTRDAARPGPVRPGPVRPALGDRLLRRQHITITPTQLTQSHKIWPLLSQK